MGAQSARLGGAALAAAAALVLVASVPAFAQASRRSQPIDPNAAQQMLAGSAAPPGANLGCSCDEMREYLKTVEKKEDCYKNAFKAGRKTSWDVLKGKNGPGGGPATLKERGAAAQQAVNSYIETCMGWVPGSAVSEGKPGTASPAEQQAAEDACKAAHCEWICRVSVRSVHEQYHVWYDSNQRMWTVTFLVRYGAWGEGPQAMQQENIVGEIGAHDAEAQFLRDVIAEAEKNGKCNNVRRTVDDKERQQRIKDASDRVKKYLDSLGDKP